MHMLIMTQKYAECRSKPICSIRIKESYIKKRGHDEWKGSNCLSIRALLFISQSYRKYLKQGNRSDLNKIGKNSSVISTPIPYARNSSLPLQLV